MNAKQISAKTFLISNNYATVKLTSLAGDLELANPTITHRVIQVNGPLVALVLSVRPEGHLDLDAFSDERFDFNPEAIRINGPHGAYIQFKTPQVMTSGYIQSYPETDKVAGSAPLQSSIVTLNHGVMTVSGGDGKPLYRCRPEGCTKLASTTSPTIGQIAP
ncbi:MAG TPA: hypothetical protein VFM48_00485 [Aquabacterium sp.]|nr:hypothetical protein [Aquabacterium sp.]